MRHARVEFSFSRTPPPKSTTEVVDSEFRACLDLTFFSRWILLVVILPCLPSTSPHPYMMADNIGSSSALLPPGWTSHVSPAGRTYYHNPSTGVSTYAFPTPKPPKREKPVCKTPIPNTCGWLKVTTNRDNVFYFNPHTNRSEWLPPREVVAALKQMQEHELQEKEKAKRQQEQREWEEHQRKKRERRERKRKLEEGVPITEFDASKRVCADDEEDGDEDEDEDDLDQEKSSTISSQSGPSVTGQFQSDGAQHNADVTMEDKNDDNDDDEEEWQRQIAEQMATEAQAETEAQAQAETETETETETQAVQPSATPTTKSLEEIKTAFMTYLTSLNATRHEINPMAPYDVELCKFASHPSWIDLPKRERQDTFNEWCKLRIREKRVAKVGATASNACFSAGTNSISSSKADPFSSQAETALRSLLKAEVRSTRTKFSDFAKAFSDDPRFMSYGGSNSDRETLFKQHLVELGEEKRRAAQLAESEFLQLLSDKLGGNYRDKVAAAKADAALDKEHEKQRVMQVWMQAKRTPGIIEDARYDGVGSSTRRFELFGTWASGERRAACARACLKSGSWTSNRPDDAASKASNACDLDRKLKEKDEDRQAALRQREQKVRLERSRVERLNLSAMRNASREESLRCFEQLLLDRVHSADVDYETGMRRLCRDARFDSAQLTDADRKRLFEQHMSRLRAKQEDRLGVVFARHAPTLSTHREHVLALTRDDADLSHPPLSVYAQDETLLRAAYDRWHSHRCSQAEQDFKHMLSESAFVDFWGRLKSAFDASQSSTLTSVPETKQHAILMHQPDDQDEQADASTSLIVMASKVDLNQIESVLKNDARFRAWNHDPETRRSWIRDHLQRLAAPAMSVHR